MKPSDFQPLPEKKIHLEKIPYILGNGTLLYSRKGIFRTLTYSEPEEYSET